MKINANGTEISIILSKSNNSDYISLTDIAKYKNPEDPRFAIQNWMRNRNTIEFLGTWEKLSNPNFNRVQFEAVKSEAGLNRFIMTPSRWINEMSAIGMISKPGRYGGTYAHSDIAFEFASWISPEFKLYIIKDYQRLKYNEAKHLEIGWDTKRELSKINYHIHTDAIKEYLITPELTKQEINYQYASEADILNIALFGKTAKQWREENKNAKKNENIRDYASVEQLIVLINLESMNADLIRQCIPQIERLQKLRSVAYYQLNSLKNNNAVNRLKQTYQNQIEDK